MATRAPGASEASPAGTGARATSTSSTAARASTPARRKAGGTSVGRSLRLCTAMSMLPACRACSSSRVKTPLSIANLASGRMSPLVRMTMRSKTASGNAVCRADSASAVWASARSLPRVPSRRTSGDAIDRTLCRDSGPRKAGKAESGCGTCRPGINLTFTAVGAGLSSPWLASWMGAGVVERARLESACAPKGHRGFESRPIRQGNTRRKAGQPVCQKGADNPVPSLLRRHRVPPAAFAAGNHEQAIAPFSWAADRS